MDNFIFVSGNQHKADYLSKWLGRPVNHQNIDLDEIQSLDLRQIVEHKARQAYEKIKKPVLVEDVALSFNGLNRLPGPFIKWFLEDLGVSGLCQLADGLASRKASADIEYALFDGQYLKFFKASVKGSISDKPRGNSGFGWNEIFIPDGTNKTYAEMTENEFRIYNMRYMAISKIRKYFQES
jgi:XTP/dITP diphosphohydrolase